MENGKMKQGAEQNKNVRNRKANSQNVPFSVGPLTCFCRRRVVVVSYRQRRWIKSSKYVASEQNGKRDQEVARSGIARLEAGSGASY